MTESNPDASKPETPTDIEVLISDKLGKDVLKDLVIQPDEEHAEAYVWVRPKKFLGTETFGKLASVLRPLGAEWFSRGKQSAFRVPLQVWREPVLPGPVPASTPAILEKIQQVIIGLKTETQALKGELPKIEGRVKGMTQMVTDLERVVATLTKPAETDKA